jgi:NADPH:quinone reductase-like Zn-dependent oxidoreductase
MKAIIINKHGDTDVLQYVEDFPMPEIKEKEVLVRIHSTSLNRVDVTVRKGYPGLNIPMPHILGGDIAGEIAALGNNVDDFAIGDRVVVYPVYLPEIRDEHYGENEFLNDGWSFFGMQRNGSYCEYLAVPTENLFKIPENLDYASAASLPIAGLTAYHAVNRVGEFREDDVFFIWGGSGGLGTFAIQLAKAKGAKVITTAGKNYKKQELLDLGADYVFNHFEDNVPAEIRKIAPKGVDYLIDYVGPATFDKSFSMLRKNGTLIFCGMLTGMEVKLNIQQTYFRHINIHGIYLGNKHDFFHLINLAAEGKIKPVIKNQFNLSEASKAHKLMESGNYIGKIILNV